LLGLIRCYRLNPLPQENKPIKFLVMQIDYIMSYNLSMKDIWLYGFFRSLLKEKKIAWGIAIDILSLVLQIFTDIDKIWFYLLVNAGVVLIVWGLFQYSNFLYKEFKNYKEEGFLKDLALSDQAESFFKQFNLLIKNTVATLKLKEMNSDIKLVKCLKGGEGQPQVVLMISGLDSKLIGSQIACVEKEKVRVRRRNIFVDKTMGYLEIEKIDEEKNLAYCLMLKKDDGYWKGLRSAAISGQNVSFRDNTFFTPEVYESFNKFKLAELIAFSKLVSKFSNF